MKKTANPQFIRISLTEGLEYTLNLNHYDPEKQTRTRRGTVLQLRNGQKVTTIEDPEQIESAYVRYVESQA